MSRDERPVLVVTNVVPPDRANGVEQFAVFRDDAGQVEPRHMRTLAAAKSSAVENAEKRENAGENRERAPDDQPPLEAPPVQQKIDFKRHASGQIPMGSPMGSPMALPPRRTLKDRNPRRSGANRGE